MGFLGLGNNLKPGKGVSKNEVEKKSFFEFFDKLFRNVGRMLKLHFIYLVFCIPIITIGPATVALVKLMHLYIHEKPVFMFSDFLKEFKSNFKQGLIIGILNFVMASIFYLAIQFYARYISVGWFMYILVVMASFVFLLFIFSLLYSYLLCGLINMSVFSIIKNSFILAILGMKRNFIATIFNILISIPAIFISLIFPPLFLILAPHGIYAFTSAFNAFPCVYKYIIKPYYKNTGERNPYEKQKHIEDEVIFTDALEIERESNKKASKEKNKKIIK